MPLVAPAPILSQLKAHCAEMDRRAKSIKVNELYMDGEDPLAKATQESSKRSDGIFGLLADLSRENYAAAPVRASLERLEQTGFRWGSADATKQAWEIHQRNEMATEGRLTMETALVNGRGFEIVWDETGDGKADITVESPLNVVVEYEPGSRHRRIAATRRWQDSDGRWYATLFRSDNLWKFVGPDKHSGDGAPDEWQPHETAGEPWPLPNPLGVVPVVEHPVGRKLRVAKAHQARFGVVEGEFEPHLPLIDRIQFTTFCGLAGVSWSGFQTLALFGVKRRFEKKEDGSDDLSKPLPPFEYAPGVVVHFEEDKDSAELQTLPAADAKAFLEHASNYIGRYASLARMPLYKVDSQKIVNIGAEGLRMLDDGYIAKLSDHARLLGAARVESTRLALLVEGNTEAANFAGAETVWADLEVTTLAAKGDAFSKLTGSGVPWQVAADVALGMSPTAIAEMAALIAASPAPVAPPQGADGQQT